MIGEDGGRGRAAAQAITLRSRPQNPGAVPRRCNGETANYLCQRSCWHVVKLILIAVAMLLIVAVGAGLMLAGERTGHRKQRRSGVKTSSWLNRLLTLVDIDFRFARHPHKAFASYFGRKRRVQAHRMRV